MRKKFYITAAIPYVNAKPHLGHALEFVQADVIARYHRNLGDNTYYITGSDDNSIKVVQAAEKEGLTVADFAKDNAKLFISLTDYLNVQLDHFQHSSSDEHFRLSQELWKRCEANGDIYKDVYQGLYCNGCEAYYKAKELTPEGRCFEHPFAELESVKEENYFFRLSKYQEKISELIEKDKYKITPNSRKKEALAFIFQGLEDISISRSRDRAKNWGVPVPNDETQIMYVWFDALNVYRSAAPEEYWPADLHVIGKGILRFHAIYWPAILLSANLPLPKELFVHGYITIGGQKMSKSIGNVVDPRELVEKYGTDPVRYHLLREIPSDADGDFTEDKFVARYNADLANGLGNFASRVLALADGATVKLKNIDCEELIKKTEEDVSAGVEERKLHDSLSAIWRLISYGDGFVNDKRVWELKGEEKETSLSELLFILFKISDLLSPFMPSTASTLSELLNFDGKVFKPAKPKEPIFKRIY